MSRLFLLITLVVCSISSPAQPNWQWLNSTTTVSNSHPEGIRYDHNANRCYTLTRENYFKNFLLTCYDVNGNQLWSVNSGVTSSGSAKVLCMDLNPDGKIVIAGVTGTSFVALGTDTLFNPNNGRFPLFYAVFDSTGASLDKGIFGYSTQYDDIYAIAMNSQDELFITTVFRDSVYFPNDTLSALSVGADIYTAKYNTQTHSLVWVKHFRNNYIDQQGDVVADNNGNCYVSCRYEAGPMIIGTDTFPTGGQDQGLLLKFDGAGNILWSKHIGSSGDDDYEKLTLDPSGNLYASGYTGALSAFPDTVTTSNSSGAFLVRYSPSGTMEKMLFGTYGPSGIDTDEYGNVYLGGESQKVVSGHTFYLAYIIKFNSNFVLEWTRISEGHVEGFSHQTISCGDSSCYYTGGFKDTTQFGTHILLQPGNGAFVVKLDGIECAFKPLTITATDSLCLNSILELHADSGFQYYQWFGAIGFSSYSDPSIVYTHNPGDCYVQAIDSGCYYRSPVFQVVQSNATAPQLSISPTDLTQICPGDSALFAVNGCTNCSYYWYAYQVPGVYSTSDSVYLSTVKYLLLYASDGTCADTVPVAVSAIYSVNNPSIIQNGTLLTATPGFTSYQWYFNSVLISGAVNNAITISQDGLYEVVVADLNGCNSADTINVISIDVAETSVMINSLHYIRQTNSLVVKTNSAATGIIIYDVTGKLVAERELSGKENEVTLPLLSPGVYVGEVRFALSVFKEKFIIE